jgi:hypothetical protein
MGAEECVTDSEHGQCKRTLDSEWGSFLRARAAGEAATGGRRGDHWHTESSALTECDGGTGRAS